MVSIVKSMSHSSGRQVGSRMRPHVAVAIGPCPSLGPRSRSNAGRGPGAPAPGSGCTQAWVAACMPDAQRYWVLGRLKHAAAAGLQVIVSTVIVAGMSPPDERSQRSPNLRSSSQLSAVQCTCHRPHAVCPSWWRVAHTADFASVPALVINGKLFKKVYTANGRMHACTYRLHGGAAEGMHTNQA